LKGGKKMTEKKNRQDNVPKEKVQDRSVSRRQFLKTSGMLIGASAVPSIFTSYGRVAEAAEDRIRLGMMTTLSGWGSIHAPCARQASRPLD
jgi:hypothetical protein